LNLGVGEGEAVSLVEDDVDGVNGLGDFCWRGHGVGLGLRFSKKEGGGKEFGYGGLGEGAALGGEEDDSFECAELVDGLAAGSAGLAGGGVEVGDGNGADAEAGTVEADGSGDGGLFGADSQAIGGVFDVTAGDDVIGGVIEQEGCADAEAAVGGVGVVGGVGSALLEVGDLGPGKRGVGEAAGGVCWRHDVSEGTGWAG
jgi:hypothetical protein